MRPAQLDSPTGDLIVSRNSDATDGVWVSLVVPTFNERQNVATLVGQVVSYLDPEYAGRYEIIFVDDNSPDGTAEEVVQIAQQYPQVHVIKRVTERGLATAVIRGWQQAAGEVFAVMDADLQHPTGVLLDLLNAIKNGADVAIASRYVDQGSVGNWNIARRTLSKGASALGFILLPEVIGRVSDPMSGYFALRRSVVAGELLKPRGYKILLEALARGRAPKIVEVPFEFGLRQHGETKVTWKLYVEYLQQLLELRMFLWSRKNGNK